MLSLCSHLSTFVINLLANYFFHLLCGHMTAKLKEPVHLTSCKGITVPNPPPKMGSTGEKRNER